MKQERTRQQMTQKSNVELQETKELNYISSKKCCKTLKKKSFLKKAAGLTLTIMMFMQAAFSQTKQKIAVIGIDTKDLSVEKKMIKNMVLLELEKASVFEVMDRYDIANVINEQEINVDNCYGRTCQVMVGNILNADKMLTGSIEKFSNKIIVIFRLIDVKTGNIEKTDVMEYINQQNHIQTMISISLNNIMGIKNDKALIDLLISYDQPIITSKTTVKLSGPRVGATFHWGEHAERMQAPEEQGGFNMYPVNSFIGYQFEQQFLSSGDFQALFEFIPVVTGMESGVFIPSVTVLLGFRFNNTGLEFGLGPVVRGTQTASGYFDENGNWQLASTLPSDSPIETVRRLDNRGKFGVSTGMIFAAGRTFRSGYLNVPVNVYFSPNKNGSYIGLIVGFNVAQLPKFEEK